MDFSAKISTHPVRNSKNQVVWDTSRNEAGDAVQCPEEKFSVGVMLWGGVSSVGLVPSNSPVFTDEFFEQYKFEKGQKKTWTSQRYGDLLEQVAKPSIESLPLDGVAILRMMEQKSIGQKQFWKKLTNYLEKEFQSKFKQPKWPTFGQ